MTRRTRVVLAVLIVASLTLLILDLRGGQGPFGSVRAAGSLVMGGLERGASTLVSPFFNVREWWGTLGDQSNRIRELERENEELRALTQTSENDRARADAVDRLLGVAGIGQYRIVPAEVIAVGPAQDFSWSVTIDAGRADGVRPDMTVMSGSGLVGRVESVTRNTAVVVLLVDADSSIGARVAGTDEVGILSGTGRQDSLDFQLLDPLAQIAPGDALVSFGSRGGRPYAPGLPIGEVIEVGGSAGQLNRIATVRPFVNVSQLSIVGVVIRPPRQDPRDSVLPQVRAPRPAEQGREESIVEVPVEEFVEELETPEDLEATPVPAP
jgi:rod shape-determining protein MreC